MPSAASCGREAPGMEICKSAKTNIDRSTRSCWCVEDLPLRLRQWAGESSFPLLLAEVKIGSSPTCDLQLHDPEGEISREHAMLKPHGDSWQLSDLNSRNGMLCDGVRVSSVILRSGQWIKIGSLVFVVESPRLVAFRAMIARLVGWMVERQSVVDAEVQHFLGHYARASPLVVIGDGDLTHQTRRLHRLALGPDAPFVVYRSDTEASEAFADAGLGTLCVPVRQQSDADKVITRLTGTDPTTWPRVVLCAGRAINIASVCRPLELHHVVTLLALSSRSSELDRIVHESAIDVIEELDGSRTIFPMRELNEWTYESKTFEDIDNALRRVLAKSIWGVTAGAARLGITHPSLSKWASKHDPRRR